jgi:hypothetical protein
MENFLKIGLVALGGYLAYDYMKKRKNNKATALLITKSPALSGVNPALIEAGMEEEGEEGTAIAEMSEAAGSGQYTSCWSVGLPAGTACQTACVQAGGTYNPSGLGSCTGHSTSFGGGTSTKKSYSRADGWDSDIISAGM